MNKRLQTRTDPTQVIKTNLPMLRFAIIPLLLFPLFAQAETFLSLQVEDLVFEKGKAIPESFDARRYYSSSLRKWVTPAAPYLRTSDAEDAFLHIVRERNNPNRLPTSTLRICLHNPKAAVKGSLFIKDGDKGVQEYPFTLNAKKTKKLAADRKSEITYLENRLEHYQRLQNLQVSRNRLVSPSDQSSVRETESSSTRRKASARKQPAKPFQPSFPQGGIGKDHRSFFGRTGNQ